MRKCIKNSQILQFCARDQVGNEVSDVLSGVMQRKASQVRSDECIENTLDASWAVNVFKSYGIHLKKKGLHSVLYDVLNEWYNI